MEENSLQLKKEKIYEHWSSKYRIWNRDIFDSDEENTKGKLFKKLGPIS